MWGCLMGSKKVESENFLKNGAQLLEQLITLCDGKCSPIKFFSEKELKKVTGNYSDTNPSLFDGNCLLFNGSHDGRSVTVKNCDYFYFTKFLEHVSVTDCIKEIAITSYVNHKNVLKLLGCCIESRRLPLQVYECASNGSLSSHIYEKETNYWSNSQLLPWDSRLRIAIESRRLPLQVYECASNGSLSSHIYEKETNYWSNSQLLPWDSRLRIAIEIADAVTYLHTATLRPIIHTNLHLKTILLDQNYAVKLSDFGYCTVIPLGKTEVRCAVRGTTEQAPEYICKGLVTEKNDVYNFGIILSELLTGRNTMRYTNPPGVQIEILDLGSVMEDNNLHEIIAPTILKEQGPIEQQLHAVADLALRCTKVTAAERPTMMEVGKELRRIKSCVYPNVLISAALPNETYRMSRLRVLRVLRP